MKKYLLLGLSLGLGLWELAAQTSKSIEALKTEAQPVIDGRLDDSLWAYAPVATGFVMLQPGNGSPAPEHFRSRIRIAYNDEAIYFGAFFYDHQPDSILHQVTVRDVYNEHTDWFKIALNPFNDGLNDFNFYLTAAGTQADSRTTSNGEDFSLNSIWHSAVRLVDSGWICEVAIPYISLRFPSKPSKDWGFNAVRSIRRNRHQYSWNFIDRGAGFNAEYQSGILRNMRDIDPPIRLSLMPYASAYRDDFRNQTSYDFNAGMDLKYGLNESFTLDATLIPDFGQVPFDNQFLNLSPFENRFQENRQFFTEGTELFSLGDIFYSRRIGGAPENITNADLSGNDSADVVVRTEFTRLLNATKISGRTNGNLGIGFLNAVTAENFAERDSAGIRREQLLEPLTNYNIFVLDQRINRSSSLSLINTNVLRNGEYVDANVAGLLASIFTPGGNYRFDAEVKRSDRFHPDSVETGYQAAARIGDVDGHWRWGIRQSLLTDHYNPNDLGFLQRANQWRNYSEVEYLTFEPSGPFNRYSLTFFSVHQSLYQPYRFEEFRLGFNSFFLLRDFTGTGLRFRYQPGIGYDYFEARQPNQYFVRPSTSGFTWFLSTDYRQPLALDLDFDYDRTPEWQSDLYRLNLEPRLRVGRHWFMIPQLIFDYRFQDRGFAGFASAESVFGERDVRNLTALITGRWAFDPERSFSIRLRHYWSRLAYRAYFDLNEDGGLASRESAGNYNLYLNALNLDLRFSWWFAPASEMVLLYRMAISNNGQELENDYLRNLDGVLAEPMQNNLSLRISYFFDYNRTRQWLREKG